MSLLTRIVGEEETRRAFEQLLELHKRHSQQFERSVGHPAGSHLGPTFWVSDHGYWFHPVRLENRYWLAFGLENPSEKRLLTVMVEINPPLQGVNRSVGGIFLRDERGAYYLAHTGKIGGGRRGVGRANLLTLYDYQAATPLTDIGPGERAFLFGPLDDEEALAAIGRHVREVQRVKDQITA